MSIENRFPSETIDLPSKGWFYSPDSPLASGQLDIYLMTAKHEDILTSRNLIQRGVVIDKLLEALIANPAVKLDELLLGDKAAIMIAARILGYGKDYQVSINCESCGAGNEMTIDLQSLAEKEVDFFTPENKGRNGFPFLLPVSGKTVVFKFLTHADEKAIRTEIDGMKKVLKSEVGQEMTTRIRRSIISVDGSEDGEIIRNFINAMPARDSRSLRDFVRKHSPDVDLSHNFTCKECGFEGRVEVPIDVTFFWPDSGV